MKLYINKTLNIQYINQTAAITVKFEVLRGFEISFMFKIFYNPSNHKIIYEILQQCWKNDIKHKITVYLTYFHQLMTSAQSNGKECQNSIAKQQWSCPSRHKYTELMNYQICRC